MSLVSASSWGFSFKDIKYWVGSGTNECAVVIDFNDGSVMNSSFAWGYRWNGDAPSFKTILDEIAADDPRLASFISDSGWVSGFGYDVDDDGGTFHTGKTYTKSDKDDLFPQPWYDYDDSEYDDDEIEEPNMYMVGDDWAAEDAVMDALGKICAHTGDFGGLPEKSRRRLAMRITENAALDRRRRQMRRAALEVLAPASADREKDGLSDGSDRPDGEWTNSVSDGISAVDAYFLAEEFGTLAEAVNGLPAKYRDMVRLRYGEGFANAEIARLYGIPESTVSTRLERARSMLRRWLERAGPKKGENE